MIIEKFYSKKVDFKSRAWEVWKIYFLDKFWKSRFLFAERVLIININKLKIN